LRISRQLAEQDPSNAGWQSDLGAAHSRVVRISTPAVAWFALAGAYSWLGTPAPGAEPAAFAVEAAPPTRPNILWLVSEDNGRFLGCYV
jgi:hypothetical protein